MMSYINETDFVIENKELVYPEIITDGLQLYYDAKGKRDTDYHRDTMLDMSGNKNHGKLQNFAYEKHSGYKDGLVFDYIDDKLVRPSLNLQPNDFTFMLNGNIISFSPDGTVKRIQDGEVIESKGFNMLYDMERASYHSLDVKYNYNHAVARWVDSSNGNTFLYSTAKYIYKDKHKYYISYNAKPDGYVRLRIYANQRYLDGDIDKPILNEYNFRSGIVEAESQYGDSFNVRLLFGSESVIGTKVEVKDLMMIDLTETFGAGNEPTKNQMDEIINQFGFIPNAQDLIDRIEYKGNDLGDMENIIDGLYKTEVLSGEEIYTDKSDDAVVHVEVDGETVGGGGRNLISKSDIEPWNGVTNWENDILSVQTTGSAGARIPSSVFEINQKYTLSFKARLISGTVYGIMGHSQVFDTVGYQNGNRLGSWTGSVTSAQEELIIGKEYNYKINLTKIRDSDWLYIQPNRGNYTASYKIELYDFQLNAGDDSLEYDGLSPTPDDPNEIHSLNDFDVVSSVGRENLRKPSKVFQNNSNADVKISNKYIYEGEESYELITKVEGGALKYWRLSTNPGNTPMILNAYTTYTFSWYLYGSDSYVSSYIYVDNSHSFDILKKNKISLGNGFSRYTVTIRYNSPVDGYPSHGMLLYANNLPINENLYISGIKIEVGDEATPYTEYYESAEYNTDYPTLHKINLSLDEPLRSVGDVKDRLFRDSDGLWKIERNVGEDILDSSSTMTNFGYDTYDTDVKSNRSFTPSAHHPGGGGKARTTHFVRYEDGGVWVKPDGVGFSLNSSDQFHISFPNSLLGVITTDSKSVRDNKIREWLDSEKNKGTPLTIQYSLRTSKIETLSQDLQDKLNNLRSFEDSNYIYTVLPNENSYLSEDLKPTLHAKFLYNNWYKEDRVINNLMIYNRALMNEEMLQNYKTIKRRWGM